jgi:excisionase family DNA binding protein
MATLSNTPRFLSTPDVAECLGVSTRTVHRMIADGKLGAIRPGSRRWRIPSDELTRLATLAAAGRQNGAAS